MRNHFLFLMGFMMIAAIPLMLGSCGVPTPTISKGSSPGFNSTPSWKVIGNADFTQSYAEGINLTLGNGTLYMGYMDGTNGQKAAMMTYNGNGWSSVGSDFSTITAFYVSPAINGGIPYAAYEDASTSPNYKATVMSYNGGSWAAVGNSGIMSGQVGYTSLAFIGTTPYLAFVDVVNSSKPSVISYNGSAWSYVGGTYITTDGSNFTSLAVSGSTLYLAYQDTATNKATVMSYNGSVWSAVGSASFSAGSVSNLSLAMNGSTPYVAFADSTTTPSGKCTVMTYNGSSWVIVGTAGFSSGSVAGDTTSIAFNGSTPYVAYDQDSTNGNKATLMSYNGTSWQNVGGVAGFSSGPATYSSLAFYNGNPYVAFSDGNSTGKATVMSYQ